MTLAPGEGVFLKKSPTSPSLTITFVGEVMQGTLVNPVALGYDIYSAMVPQQGGITTVHNYPPTTGDQVYRWNPASGGYIPFTRLATGAWIPSEPVLAVNEAVWIKANAVKNWTRDFTVAP
jgi:hypothetical protein